MSRCVLSRCEWTVLGSTSVLCCVVRLARSPSLLDRLLEFLLRTPSVLQPLLRRCDHTSDQVRPQDTPTKPLTWPRRPTQSLCPQISVASLSLVDELLQKPHRDVLDTLVLGFLQSRRYLSSPAGGAEDRQSDSDSNDNSQYVRPRYVPQAKGRPPSDDCLLSLRDPEDDPFFSDGFPDDHFPPPRLHQPAAPGSTADIINR